MDKPQVIKIVRPERVDRILSRVCDANLDVLVRMVGKKTTAVKANATKFENHDGQRAILLTNLSDQGVKYLWNADIVQVDFIGMATQMIFRTKIIRISHDEALVMFPKSLVSFDRRQAARHACTEHLMSYLNISIWHPRMNDITAPPVFYPYDTLSSWVAIADVSEGGFCGVSRFPSVLESYQRGVIDREAKIIFPMQLPIDAPLEVRWTRKIRESENVGKHSQSKRFYKFGIQFVDPSEELKKNLMKFINQISMAEAI